MASRDNLLLLFDRPSEPVFTVRGQGTPNRKVVFDVPDNYLSDRYRPLISVTMRFNQEANERVPIANTNLPDLTIPMQLGRQDDFSLFIPRHRVIAGKLIDIFMGVANVNDLLSCGAYARDRLNPVLFNYALSVALLHREDTKTLPLPIFMETFPEKFINCAIFQQAREEARVVPEELRRPIIIPRDFTASDLEMEHRVAYWREDIGLNLHHWHWHLVYPFEGDRRIVAKDRRGELFYYMHEQIQARYNFERLCNRLARVKSFNNFREAMVIGYYPKLDSIVAGRAWAPRQDNVFWKDLERPNDQINIKINDLERWRDRIYAAIHQGFVVDRQGTQIPLDETRGIDILGDLFEASILSVNRDFYGDLHNFGHILAGYVHDPDSRHLERLGVMADPATDLRDPFFFMWHGFVDEVFQEYKGTLPRYTPALLDYRGITVTNVSVGTDNTFNTFWQQSDVDLSRGLDFSPTGRVLVRLTHLQHRPYTYSITVNNAGAARMGTVRIFLAPKFDERGLPWLFLQQRLMFIEMDKFTTTLRPGQNNITRRHDESSVTIPFERTFRDVDANRPAAGTLAEDAFNFCGCGWPQHMMIPRGTPEGTPCELFVMVSNYEQDRVDQEAGGACSDAASYCGIRDRLYPDRRSMGYPFDRLPRNGVETLTEFLTPNMRVQDVTIRFSDTVEVNPRDASRTATALT